MAREIRPAPRAPRALYGVGPAWRGDPEERTRYVSAQRAAERDVCGALRYARVCVAGAPVELEALANGLLYEAAREHQIREHMAEYDALRSTPTIDGRIQHGSVTYEHWYQRDVPRDVRELSLELLEAVPVGADLRGIFAAMVEAHPELEPLGLQRPWTAAAEGGADLMEMLRRLREMLAAAPAWPVGVSA